MGLSRQARIITLLVIDTAFFFLELIVGYAVGSLALVADSFHMLNDVLSLVVALYTIKLATSPSSSANSYGWQRAEILGALINGVFLVALCMSIALEAIGRIVSPPDISNPKLIVIVGSMGLLSNIVGLFLFHEHGHSHDHSHGPVSLPESDAEVSDVEPFSGRKRADSIPSLYQHPAETRAQIIEAAQEISHHKVSNSGDENIFVNAMSPPVHHTRVPSMSRRNKRGSGSRSRPIRSPSINAVPPLPGSNETLPPTQPDLSSSTSTSTAVGDSSSSSHKHDDHEHNHEHNHAHNHSHSHSPDGAHEQVHLARDADAAERGVSTQDHSGHDHGKESSGGHGHSHGSMNMRGVFLHVMGDALGNVGVIAAGLVIWFCHGRWTLYFDPGVSLLITCIIFSSAIPLVKSASYILLQGVPNHVDLEAVRSSIKSVDGVVSVHELHVWQLSETTVVASVHVLILPNSDYMIVANDIRHALHSHGIHSVTIQPEFSTASAASSDDDEDAGETACLIRCPPDQCGTDTCCPPRIGNLIDVDEVDEHAGHSH